MRAKLLRRVGRFSVRMVPPVAELAGFALIVYAGWRVNEVGGLVAAGLVLLQYGYRRGA